MEAIINLLTFHSLERKLYRRAVKIMRLEPVVVKNAIALWLWLEFIGHKDVIAQIFSHADRILLLIVAEAGACLDALRPDASQPTGNNDIPATAELIKEPINLRFFHYNRDVAAHGISYFLHKVCDVIFDESVADLADRDLDRMLRSGGSFRTGGEVNSPVPPEYGFWEPHAVLVPDEAKPTVDGLLSPPPARSRLNPGAKPWSPEMVRSPVDHRSMFLTFSRGYPLKKDEVLKFFTSRWGNCVESLAIERTHSSINPMYGRVVFDTASLIPMILNGNSTAKFVVNGKHLWARMFVPKK